MVIAFGKSPFFRSRMPSFFMLGLLAVGAFATVSFLQNSTSFQTRAAGGLMVYADSIAGSWENWSWKSKVKFDSRDDSFGGKRSIAFTPSAYGSLSLRTTVPLDAVKYSVLHFAMRGSQAGQKFSVMVFDQNNKIIKSSVPLAIFGGDPEQNSWKQYEIPLRELGVTVPWITGFAIQDITGVSQPTVFVDEVSFSSSTLKTIAK